jgi:DNA-binding MarR family transcriptional regulator
MGTADQTGPPTPPGVLADDTGQLLRRAFARTRAVARQVLPPDRHPGDGALLELLDAGGPRSQQDLGERLRVNRTIMVKLVDRLETDGLVRRERNPRDRRAYALELTPTGRQALAAMLAGARRGDALLTAALTPTQRRGLNQLLRRLLPDLEAAGPPSLIDRTGFLVTHAHYRLRKRGDQALAPLGLEPHGFAALVALDDSGPGPQQRLAQQLGVGGRVIVELVDRLEQAGLLERHRNPQDRREYALRLTPSGRRRLRQAREVMEAVQAEVTEQLGQGDHRQLNALLRQLLTAPPVTATRSRTGQDPDLPASQKQR